MLFDELINSHTTCCKSPMATNFGKHRYIFGLTDRYASQAINSYLSKSSLDNFNVLPGPASNQSDQLGPALELSTLSWGVGVHTTTHYRRFLQLENSNVYNLLWSSTHLKAGPVSIFGVKKSTKMYIEKWRLSLFSFRGRRYRDRMVVGFTTTYAIGAYHHWCCWFESRSGRGVQHYVIKFVSDLLQVGGFLRFPPPI